MLANLKRSALLLFLGAPIFFLAACASDSGVTQAQYDSVVSENQQLKQQAALDQDHIRRLQSAIKYTVNSDLLFPPGGYELSAAGKDIIAKMARILAPHQQEHLVVNGYTDNAPIGSALQAKGIDSNQALSEMRADAVMKYMISQGVNPDYVSAKGWGEADPVAPNTNDRGRAQNRRVEITIAGS
jgi:chemotaxis protein MotB